MRTCNIKAMQQEKNAYFAYFMIIMTNKPLEVNI